jgi:uncharacterized protein
MEHPDAAAYLRTADAFRAKDNELLAELIAEDVVWHFPGSSSLAGDIHGREALFEWFGRLLAVTDNTFSLEEHDVLASDEHVVALSIIGAIRNGVPLGQNVVSVFHFREGRQVDGGSIRLTKLPGIRCSAAEPCCETALNPTA